MKKSKLIIWDFDGVIADTEGLWMHIWQDMVNEHFQLGWDFQETCKWFYGSSPQWKVSVLKEHFGIELNDEIRADFRRRFLEVCAQGIDLVDGVKEVIAMNQFAGCLATNGHKRESLEKIKAVKLEEYFSSENIFSSDLVPRGKPAPDLHLYTAEKMGYSPAEVIIIEDSLVGLQAGLSAGMTTIAFSGCTANYIPDYIEKTKALGITEIFDNMPALKDYLLQLTCATS